DSSHAAPFLAQLDRLAVEANADRTPSKEADMTFVSALEQWIAAAHPLPDGQRAASLLAADQLLEEGLHHFGIAALAERRLRPKTTRRSWRPDLLQRCRRRLAVHAQ